MRNRSKAILVGCVAGLLYVVSASAQAAVVTGQSLHDASCVTCHASKFGGDATKIYSREDRKVKSLDMLNSQVTRCAGNAAKDWGTEEVGKVVEYLNSSYYHFEAPKH